MRTVLACVAVTVMLAVSGCSGPGKAKGAGTREFTLTAVPYEDAPKLVDQYTPMAQYLAKRIGRTGGTFRYVADYTGVVAALQAGQVDVAYLSAFPYALATKRIHLQPLAMPHVKNRLMYRGIIFVRADSPIKTVADLKGRTFAFGDQSSTSGYLLPRALLEKAGVFKQLHKYYNAGVPPEVVKAVETGSQDAGAAYENVFEVVYKDAPEKARNMRIIAQTDEIPNGIYVARADMPAADVAKLAKAFMDMNTTPEGQSVMHRVSNDREVPANDAQFDGVRAAASILGLDLKALGRK